jgi:alkyl sulfatase BDS1-like metallo-beta-lactamase superfamily hydrolase
VFHDELPKQSNATFVATKDLLDRILLGETNVKQALADDELTIEGDNDAAEAFFGYFDPPSSAAIKLVVR